MAGSTTTTSLIAGDGQGLAVGRVRQAGDGRRGVGGERRGLLGLGLPALLPRRASAASASTFAPWSIQRSRTSIWSRGIDVLGGICGCRVPSMNWTIRLSVPLPGTIAGPRRPPFSIASTSASERSEVAKPSSWQARQCSSRNGATSRLKLTGASSAARAGAAEREEDQGRATAAVGASGALGGRSDQANNSAIGDPSSRMATGRFSGVIRWREGSTPTAW